MLYGIWHGGSSYSTHDELAYLERFPSIRAACDALRDRERFGYTYRQRFDYVTQGEQYHLTPSVTTESAVYLYAARPTTTEHPNWIVEFGPRGGIHVRKA